MSKEILALVQKILKCTAGNAHSIIFFDEIMSIIEVIVGTNV